MYAIMLGKPSDVLNNNEKSVWECRGIFPTQEEAHLASCLDECERDKRHYDMIYEEPKRDGCQNTAKEAHIYKVVTR